MVFSGLMGMEGLVVSSTEGGGDTLLLSSGCRSQRELFGSGHVRGAEEGSSRWLKMARTDQKSPNGSGNDHSLLLPDGQQHMLSFSSARHDPLGLGNHGGFDSAPPGFVRSGGVAYGGQSQTMHGVLGGDRGPFTPSQWIELEHHAMIYKYIEANVPIPSSLLISLRRNQNPPLYGGYSLGPLAPTSYGWGSLQLGFSGSSDPEPGRCRRTDGKKWRCSRDAVVDQKYCERHMNRGRHRSRKPVEGHNGQAKTMPTIASSPAVNAASTIVASTNLSIADKQLKDFQTGSSNQPVVHFNRTLPNKEALSIPMNMKSQNAVPLVSKQYDPFDISLLNSSRTSYMKNRNNSPSSDMYEKEAHPQLLHHFMDNMPKKQSDRLSATWADTEQIHSARTQLSISISNSDASSVSSLVQELVTPAPLRSSLELDPIPLGLCVDTILDSGNQGRGNWTSISWGSSMGGPLAEVLYNTNNKSNYVNSSLNLVQSWNLSPELDSSPTGVLQKTAFRSHSSSAGSSPRADNFKEQENVGSLCDELLEPTLTKSPSTASM